MRQATATGKDTIWIGPYATDTTATLQQRKSSLGNMASDLLADAKRWETEADNLDDRAKAAGQGSHGGH
ncbi:hypothetical protein ABZ746_17145 [Streptomyces sp. NPDC020096]